MAKQCIFSGLSVCFLISVQGTKEVPKLQCENQTRPPEHAFCLSEGYDKHSPPHIHKSTVNVTVVVSFDDIVEVNDDDCTVTFDIDLAISWIEPRLKIIPDFSTWHQNGNKMRTFVPSDNLELLWVPDLDIPNIKKFEIRNVLKEQSEVEIMGNKRIWYSFRVQITLNCPNFDFGEYPFDTQFCKFLIGSYQWDSDHLLFQGNITYDSSDQRPLQYNINYIKALTFQEGLEEFENFDSLPDGQIEYYIDKYSHFAIKMEFTRRLNAYFVSTYLPSFLIVVSSWLGFVIGTSSIPGRLTVTVILLLVLINMSASLRSTMPNTSVISAIGIWIIACIFMVFGALTEYGVILIFMKKSQKEINQINSHFEENDNIEKANILQLHSVHKEKNGLVNSISLSCNKDGWTKGNEKSSGGDTKDNFKENKLSQDKIVEKIDNLSLLIFPSVFFLFVAVYFVLFIQ